HRTSRVCAISSLRVLPGPLQYPTKSVAVTATRRAQRHRAIVAGAGETWMHRESAPEHRRRLAVAAERHVAEPGARQRAEVMRVARERLRAIGDRALVVLGHVADGRALVPPLGERGSPRDHAGEDGLGAGEVPALHDGNALAEDRA